MPTNEQRREAARRKLERQIVNRQVRAKRNRIIGVSSVVVVALLVTGTVVFEPWKWFEPKLVSSGPCQYAKPKAEEGAPEPEKAAKDTGFDDGLPDDPEDTPKTGIVKATLKTSQGDIALNLDRSKAPCTVQSFLALAKANYYNDSTCHRLVVSADMKILQCGDPKGTGQGGPGYTIKDELDGAKKLPELTGPEADQAKQAGKHLVNYTRGTLAMAKTAAPNSGGSQFFLVFGDTKLPDEYAVFGTVSEDGLKALDKIGAGGNAEGVDESTGGPKPAPKLTTKIEKVDIAA
ncbi:peptidylprolyl isomerase [Pseudonocardiaceae bacterium YIM PH 21723]|nr:peptidylprolyl isomerase [Pseudonocardiaceae bacterium YIM PH 21723]